MKYPPPQSVLCLWLCYRILQHKPFMKTALLETKMQLLKNSYCLYRTSSKISPLNISRLNSVAHPKSHLPQTREIHAREARHSEWSAQGRDQHDRTHWWTKTMRSFLLTGAKHFKGFCSLYNGGPGVHFVTWNKSVPEHNVTTLVGTKESRTDWKSERWWEKGIGNWMRDIKTTKMQSLLLVLPWHNQLEHVTVMTSVISAPRKRRQEDCFKVKVSLSPMARASQR